MGDFTGTGPFEYAQACANQAIAEATLLAMRRAHASGCGDGRDGELEAWPSGADGVAGIARVLVVSHGGAWAAPSTWRG